MKVLRYLVVLIIRLAVGWSSAPGQELLSDTAAFTRGRGLYRDPRVRRLSWASSATIAIGRRACARGARSRGRRTLRLWFPSTGAYCNCAAPAVQRTRSRRVPTFDGIVVRMLFDDDRLAVTPFKTSKCDLRVNDASPRKSPRRLAGELNTRGVGRRERGVAECGQWTTEQVVSDPVRQERIFRHQLDAVELATRAMRELDVPWSIRTTDTLRLAAAAARGEMISIQELGVEMLLVDTGCGCHLISEADVIRAGAEDSLERRSTVTFHTANGASPSRHQIQVGMDGLPGGKYTALVLQDTPLVLFCGPKVYGRRLGVSLSPWCCTLLLATERGARRPSRTRENSLPAYRVPLEDGRTSDEPDQQ